MIVSPNTHRLGILGDLGETGCSWISPESLDELLDLLLLPLDGTSDDDLLDGEEPLLDDISLELERDRRFHFPIVAS